MNKSFVPDMHICLTVSDKRGQISRKDFLKLLGVGGAGLLIGRLAGFGNLFSDTNHTNNQQQARNHR